ILPIVVLCSIAEIGHGSFPKTMFVYAASLVVLWMSFGQSVLAFPSFVSGSSEIVFGYKEAMAIWRIPALWSLIPLVIASALLWTAASTAACRIGRWTGSVISTSLFLVLYAVLLNGYVRGDSFHIWPCILTIFGLWALVKLMITRVGPKGAGWLMV